MAMTVADLEAVLRLRDEMTPALVVASQSVAQANATIASLQQRLDSLTAGNATAAFNAMNVSLASVQQSAAESGTAFVAMGTLIANEVQKVVYGFVQIKDESIRLAAELEKVTVSSRFMTASLGMTSSETDRVADSMTRFGVSGVGARNAIISMTRANIDLGKSSQLAAVAQNAARLSGDSTSATLERMVFAIQMLHPRMLRSSGIMLDMAKANKEWAKANTTTVQSMSQQDKQAAMLNAVLAQGSKIAGVAAASSDTLAAKTGKLNRVQEEAYTNIGKELIPAQKAWIALQTQFYDAVKEHPQLFLALAGGVAAFSLSLGQSLPVIGPWLTGIIDMGKAIVKFVGDLMTAGTAQEAFQGAMSAAEIAAAGTSSSLTNVLGVTSDMAQVLGTATSSTMDFSGALGTTADSAQVLGTAVQLGSSELSNLSGVSAEAAASVSRMSGSLDAASVAASSASLSEGASSTLEFSDALDQTASAATITGTALAAAARPTKDMVDVSAKAADSVSRMSGALEITMYGVSQTAEVLTGASSSTADFSKSLSGTADAARLAGAATGEIIGVTAAATDATASLSGALTFSAAQFGAASSSGQAAAAATEAVVVASEGLAGVAGSAAVATSGLAGALEVTTAATSAAVMSGVALTEEEMAGAAAAMAASAATGDLANALHVTSAAVLDDAAAEATLIAAETAGVTVTAAAESATAAKTVGVGHLAGALGVTTAATLGLATAETAGASAATAAASAASAKAVAQEGSVAAAGAAAAAEVVLATAETAGVASAQAAEVATLSKVVAQESGAVAAGAAAVAETSHAAAQVLETATTEAAVPPIIAKTWAQQAFAAATAIANGVLAVAAGLNIAFANVLGAVGLANNKLTLDTILHTVAVKAQASAVFLGNAVLTVAVAVVNLFGGSLTVAAVKQQLFAAATWVANTALGAFTVGASMASVVLGGLLIVVLLVVAALASWKIGKMIGEWKLFEGGTRSVTDQFGMLWASLSGGVGAMNDYQKNIIDTADAQKRAAKAAEEHEERVKKLREEMAKTPANQIRAGVEDLAGAFRGDTLSQNPETLKNYLASVKKLKEDAAKQGVSIDFKVGGSDVAKEIADSLDRMKKSRVDELVRAFNIQLSTTKAQGGDLNAVYVNAALRVADIKNQFTDGLIPEMEEAARIGDGILATQSKYRPQLDDAGKAAKAALIDKIKGNTTGEQRTGMLADLEKKTGPVMVELNESLDQQAKAAKKTEVNLATLGGEMGKHREKAKESAKAGRELALSMRGFIGEDEITKVTATVSSLGGASKMSAEETLKVGESLSKAAAAGQKLAPELMAVVKNYGAVSAQQEVLAAKGGLAAQALKDQAALFTSVAAAGAIPTEMIMKYGEALYKTQQAGVTLQPVLAGVAAEWAKLSSADKAFMAAGGMSADAMQKQEAELQKLAEAGKLTNAVIKEQGPAAVAAAAAGQTLGEKQQFVADSFRKTSAEMAAMSAQGFLAEDELKKLATNFLELGDKIPIELLNQSGEALWKMAVAGKLAKENLPGMTPEAIAALQTQAEAWATNSLKETAGVGPTAGPNKAVKDLQDKIKLQQGQAGGLYGMGTEALGGLLKSVQSAAAGATGDYALVGQQLMADIMEGMRKTGEKGLQGQTPEALRALAEGFKATGEQQKALGTAEGLKAADAAAKNLTVTMAEMHNQGLLTADEIARIDANETKAAESAVKWGGILSGIVGLAGMLGGKFEGVAQVVGNIGDSWARIGSMPSPAKALAEFQKANASINAQSKNVLGTKLTGQEMFDKVEKDAKRAKLMAKIGAGAQVLGQVGGMLDKGTGNQQVAAKTMQGAAAGAQMGMIAGPIGAGVGAVIGGVLGFLKGSKLKKDAKAAGKALGMEVSQELAKQIQDTAKDLKIDIKSAALLNLSSAMAESKKAAGTFAPQVASLMKGIADGSIPAAQGLEQVGEAFTKIADEAMKAGTVGSREMVALIKQARAMKIDSPEIKAFVGEQLNLALAGVKKFVSAIKVLDEEWVKWLKDSRGDALGEEGMKKAEDGIKSLGKTAGVVFGAMFSALAEENGIVSAVDAMSEDFASLKESLSASLGPEMASQILGPFAAAFDTIGNEHLRPLFEGIDGLSQAMKGLANAGYLNTEQFAAMQAGIGTMFDLSIAGGADMKTSLLAVSPAIQAAISAAQEFGIPLDADTQRLKTLAEQNGITFKTDPMRAMLDVMVEIAKVLGADIPDSVAKMRASVEGGTAATTTAAEEAATAAQTAKEAFDAGMKESMGDNTKEGWVAKFGEAVQAGREAVTEFTTMQQTAAFAALQTAQTVGAGVSAAAGASILSMAQAAEAGSAQAAAALQASLQSGALSVGDLANDPAWAALVTQLSSDVPEAARAAAAAIAAIIANVPGAINIPVNVTNGGGGATPEPPPPETPEGFAGGTQGWRSFSSKGTPVVLHNTEAVIRPGDPVLPGQVGGNTTTVHLNINENPMQTAQTVEQMRRFTLRAAERELSKNLSGRIEAGKA